MSKFNKVCWQGYVRTFQKLSKEEWITKMVDKFHRVNSEPVPSASMVKSWENEFDVLQNTFSVLPQSYGELFLLFEYVIPVRLTETGETIEGAFKRPDAVVLSKNTVTILEFKDRGAVYDAAINQVKGYRKKIKRYHDQSRGMYKRAVAVFTMGNSIKQYNSRKKVYAVSPDTFAEILYEIYKEAPIPIEPDRTSEWRRTTYSDHQKEC